MDNSKESHQTIKHTTDRFENELNASLLSKNPVTPLQESECTTLINEAITNLQQALPICSSCTEACQCSANLSFVSKSANQTLLFLGQEITGSTSIQAIICQECNLAKSAVIFNFLTESLFPITFTSTSIQSTTCHQLPQFISISGTGVLTLGPIPFSGISYVLSFGGNLSPSCSQCSFSLNINTTPNIALSTDIPCECLQINNCK